MSSPRQAVLCRYRYDPLDRLATTAPTGQAGVLRFYQKSRLVTEIQGAAQHTVFQHDDQLLAQQQRQSGITDTTLLATDHQRSVLHAFKGANHEPLSYTAYGHHPADSGLNSLFGFNGERRDPVTGHYMLGNGYRAFNPVLMRFNSPDSLSPFGEGGLNAYAYCQGDPVNFGDQTGHARFSILTNSSVRNRMLRTGRFSAQRSVSELSTLVSRRDVVIRQLNVLKETKSGQNLHIVESQMALSTLEESLKKLTIQLRKASKGKAFRSPIVSSQKNSTKAALKRLPPEAQGSSLGILEEETVATVQAHPMPKGKIPLELRRLESDLVDTYIYPTAASRKTTAVALALRNIRK